MVLLHVKTAEERNQFLFETTTQELVSTLTAQLVEVHLTRVRALKAAEAAEALATYGPLRPEQTRGLTEEVAALSNLDVTPDGPPSNPDPNHYRTGVPPPKEVAEVIKRTCKEVAEKLSHKKAERREKLCLAEVKESLDLLRGAVHIAYPAFHGLPSWEPTVALLEGSDACSGYEISESITEENARLWWTGKQLQPDEPLSKYLGTNEKTRTVVRLQPKSAAIARCMQDFYAGPPVREPRMDSETHRAVLEYLHKKRETDQELAKDEDDSYLWSPWADPKGLKKALTNGGSEIKWRY